MVSYRGIEGNLTLNHAHLLIVQLKKQFPSSTFAPMAFMVGEGEVEEGESVMGFDDFGDIGMGEKVRGASGVEERSDERNDVSYVGRRYNAFCCRFAPAFLRSSY